MRPIALTPPLHTLLRRTAVRPICRACSSAGAALGLVVLLCASSGAQPPARPATNTPRPAAPAQTDQAAIQKASDAYCAVYSKADAQALKAFWTADAEYLDADGTTVRGRDAIGEYFAERFAETPSRGLQVRITSLRFLKPDVAMEDGLSTVTEADGEKSTGRYSAIWTKAADGRWLLARVQDLPGELEPVLGAHYRHVKALEWLVGQWTANAAGGAVEQLSCTWILDRNYLAANLTISAAGRDAVVIEQIYGWDAKAGGIHMWYFDSHGGRGDGVLKRDGKEWTIEVSGVHPDGRAITAVHALELLDAGTFVWRSRNAKIDGAAVPNEERKFTRASSQR